MDCTREPGSVLMAVRREGVAGVGKVVGVTEGSEVVGEEIDTKVLVRFDGLCDVPGVVKISSCILVSQPGGLTRAAAVLRPDPPLA